MSRAQALASGVTQSKLDANVRARRWQRLGRGIYVAFTGPFPQTTRLWVALLACGRGAVLSHQTAAQLSGLVVPRDDSAIHVTVPAGRKVRPPMGVKVHRSRNVSSAAHPALTPPRTRIEVTVLDLIDGSARADEAVALLAQACQQRLTTPAKLAQSLRQRPNLRWRKLLVEMLHDIRQGAQTLLELRYLRDVERAHGLPKGKRQRSRRRAGRRWYDDVAYDEYELLVELDGRLGHDEAADRFRDMRRDNAAALMGQLTLRYGWHDVASPCRTAAQVAAVLRKRGWTGTAQRCGPSCSL